MSKRNISSTDHALKEPNDWLVTSVPKIDLLSARWARYLTDQDTPQSLSAQAGDRREWSTALEISSRQVRSSVHI